MDPSFTDELPQKGLHFDYMSSEYSSPGEDSDGDELGCGLARRGRWDEMLGSRLEGEGEGKGGWAVGLGEKVLEVRTPRWRSAAVSHSHLSMQEFSLMSKSAEQDVPPARHHFISTGRSEIEPKSQRGREHYRHESRARRAIASSLQHDGD